MSRSYKFASTADVLESIAAAEPDFEHVEPANPDDFEELRAKRVTWLSQGAYIVQIPAENVLFMEGNIWNPGHGRALYDGIMDGSLAAFEVPPARVYRVDAARVKMSQKLDKTGELEYQLGMLEPWDASDRGSYYAQLLDGNHRAAAALLAGEPFIYVYCGENTRENVRKKDWV